MDVLKHNIKQYASGYVFKQTHKRKNNFLILKMTFVNSKSLSHLTIGLFIIGLMEYTYIKKSMIWFDLSQLKVSTFWESSFWESSFCEAMVVNHIEWLILESVEAVIWFYYSQIIVLGFLMECIWESTSPILIILLKKK